MKKRKWKKLLASILSAGMLAASCLGVSAGSLEDYFDANHYTSQYEDLQKAFGSDPVQLWNHFQAYGLQEGRDGAIPFLNLAKYRAAYKDLEEAFGDDWTAYMEHYLAFGIKEKRCSFTEFDAAAYVERYPDLMEAFGYDAAALYRHWLTFGKEEGRNAGREQTAPAAGDSSGGQNGTVVKPGGDEEPGGNEQPGGDEEPGGDEKPGGDVTGGDVTGGDNPGGDEPDVEDPLMALNKDGYFAEAFCRTLDLDAPAEWSPAAMLIYSGLPDEGKKVLDQVQTIGDVYDYGSITFYPNGSMKWSFKFKDEVHAAFVQSDLFLMFFPQVSKVDEQPYTVDKEGGRVILENGTVLALDTAEASLTASLLMNAEKYCIPGTVEGSGSEVVSKHTMLKDISYGEDPRNTMDVFVPINLDPAKDNGAFILVYGGSWTSGNKEDNWALAREYADAGYMAVTINMRNCTYDEEQQKTTSNVYDMLNDVQGSVKKLKSLSEEKGWNITQCATKGFSSGANIAMLYAYSRGMNVPYFDTEEVLPVRFAADVVGPVDMHDSAWYEDEEWPEEDKNVMTAPGAGPAYAKLLTGAANKGELTEEEVEECINSMSPVWYVENGGGVPTVMGYSKRDWPQSPNNGKRLKGYLDAQNVRNDLFTFPKSIHSYAADPELAQAYFDKTIEYAETYFIE